MVQRLVGISRLESHVQRLALHLAYRFEGTYREGSGNLLLFNEQEECVNAVRLSRGGEKTDIDFGAGTFGVADGMQRSPGGDQRSYLCLMEFGPRVFSNNMTASRKGGRTVVLGIAAQT